jgi:hypothetical protein
LKVSPEESNARADLSTTVLNLSVWVSFICAGSTGIGVFRCLS